ncbi:MAG: hypothetical protein JSS82_09560 [Bacteroidetes bacterium]|nr:hypothetical protein [Bacteroidota bacterium]
MPFKQKRETLWTRLVGSHSEFSMENRTFNAVGVLTLFMLLFFFLANIFIGIFKVGLVIAALIVLQVSILYLSRFRKKMQAGVAIYAIASYLAIIINFYINSGVNGPGIFFFFLTFPFLITITPKSTHVVWAILHTFIAIALVLSQYLRPELVPYTYGHYSERFTDIILSYVITILFVYFITVYLRNHYEYEKRLAEKRAQSIELQKQQLEVKNEALMKIAHIQSHEMRGPVTSIMGIMNIIKEEGSNVPKEYLQYLEEAVLELDKKIHEIVRQTSDL